MSIMQRAVTENKVKKEVVAKFKSPSQLDY